MASIVQIQLRRDTLTNWTTSNPILAQGEPALETDTGKIKFGNGSTAYNSLPYFETDKNFIFNQASAVTIWSVSHNLGKFPSVRTVDGSGTEFEGLIKHINNNNLTITFCQPISGSAYIN